MYSFPTDHFSDPLKVFTAGTLTYCCPLSVVLIETVSCAPRSRQDDDANIIAVRLCTIRTRTYSEMFLRVPSGDDVRSLGDLANSAVFAPQSFIQRKLRTAKWA